MKKSSKKDGNKNEEAIVYACAKIKKKFIESYKNVLFL
jgi:hypothetical protein